MYGTENLKEFLYKYYCCNKYCYFNIQSMWFKGGKWGEDTIQQNRFVPMNHTRYLEPSKKINAEPGEQVQLNNEHIMNNYNGTSVDLNKTNATNDSTKTTRQNAQPLVCWKGNNPYLPTNLIPARMGELTILYAYSACACKRGDVVVVLAFMLSKTLRATLLASCSHTLVSQKKATALLCNMRRIYLAAPTWNLSKFCGLCTHCKSLLSF